MKSARHRHRDRHVMILQGGIVYSLTNIIPCITRLLCLVFLVLHKISI